MFIPQAQPHAQSLFLFPIVFGINLIHFFDFFDDKEERCDRKFDRLLCCFDPLSITPCDSAKNANCFEKCNVFGNGKCEFSAIQEGKNWDANFLARKTHATTDGRTLPAYFSKANANRTKPLITADTSETSLYKTEAVESKNRRFQDWQWTEHVEKQLQSPHRRRRRWSPWPILTKHASIESSKLPLSACHGAIAVNRSMRSTIALMHVVIVTSCELARESLMGVRPWQVKVQSACWHCCCQVCPFSAFS